jgi:hypothetical protein
MPHYLNAHKLVADTAMEMANEYFELWATDNKVYAALRKDGTVSEPQARRRFAQRIAPMLFEDARQQLGKMLGMPDDAVCQTMKDEIFEALLLDHPLRSKRPVALNMATIPTELG